MSQLEAMADDIHAAAKGCKTLFHFRQRFPSWSMESVRLAAERYAPHLIPDHALTSKREPRACPKPTGKGKKE